MAELKVKDTELLAPAELAQRFRSALGLLLEGSYFARDAAHGDWEFAVEIEDLRSVGLTKNGIRWLIHKGYAMHALETTKAHGKPGRQFRPSKNLVFPSPACLVLTTSGIKFAKQLEEESMKNRRRSEENAPTATQLPPAPHWDAKLRILRVGDTIVKHFKVPAGNQELLLSAFQEEGWPPQIYDPLPPSPEIDAKRRLHDAINRLNRNQKARLIHFKGNGNGRAVYWEIAIAEA